MYRIKTSIEMQQYGAPWLMQQRLYNLNELFEGELNVSTLVSVAYNRLAARESSGVGGTRFEEWVSQAASSCVFPSGRRAAVHHVLIFPASVSDLCCDTSANIQPCWRFNNEGFNLAPCWTQAAAPALTANPTPMLEIKATSEGQLLKKMVIKNGFNVYT